MIMSLMLITYANLSYGYGICLMLTNAYIMLLLKIYAIHNTLYIFILTHTLIYILIKCMVQRY